jgi:interferon gamma-inducible protein 30
MSNLKDDIIDVASNCSQTYSLPFDKLNSCANDILGNSLLHSAGVLTDSLLPKLNYVPWIVIDKMHTNDMQKEAENDLVKYICRNYKVGLFFVYINL